MPNWVAECFPSFLVSSVMTRCFVRFLHTRVMAGCLPVFLMTICSFCRLPIYLYIKKIYTYRCVRNVLWKTDPYLKLTRGGVHNSDITLVFQGGFQGGLQKEKIQQWRRARSRPEEKDALNLIVRETYRTKGEIPPSKDSIARRSNKNH